MNECDIVIDYHATTDSVATITGVSVAGVSLLKSNTGGDASMRLPNYTARDFGIFARRRGLSVQSINEHVDTLEGMN